MSYCLPQLVSEEIIRTYSPLTHLRPYITSEHNISLFYLVIKRQNKTDPINAAKIIKMVTHQ